MCSRYEMNARPRDLVERFLLKDEPVLPEKTEVRPTDEALIVVARRPVLCRWGLRVSWDDKPLINAREETLEQRKTFRPLLRDRCLVPATAYFEWRRDGKRRFKNRISPDGQDLFAFAALTDGEYFTIITCSPVPALAHIHDRMPVILAPDAGRQWLDQMIPFNEVSALLRPFSAGTLTAREEPPAHKPDNSGMDRLL